MQEFQQLPFKILVYGELKLRYKSKQVFQQPFKILVDGIAVTLAQKMVQSQKFSVKLL